MAYINTLGSSASGGREWKVKDVTKGRQLGSPERIREKLEVKTTIFVSSELAGERENVRKAESKITELEEKVESAEKRARAAAARAVRAEIRCDRIPHLEQQLQSTQQLLHTKEEELKALSTQYRATHEQLFTQQQVLSRLQYNARQKEEQLQASIRENAALLTQRQALANQVVTLQSQITQLEQTIQATQAALSQIPYLEQQLQSKEAQLQSLTEVTQIPVQPTIPSVFQARVQTGAIGTLHPSELQSQHAELQQRMTGDSELLLQEIQEKKELLQIKSIENQEQQKELTTLKVEVQEIGEQVKALQLEKSNLEEKLAKETFLETALGYEVDALREDVMDRQQVQFHDTSTQTVVDKPGTSLTGENNSFFFFVAY